MITIHCGYIAPKAHNRKENRLIKTDNPYILSVKYFLELSENNRIEREYCSRGKVYKVKLDDGTIITHRFNTKSNSPAIFINATMNSKYKTQKVHFERY